MQAMRFDSGSERLFGALHEVAGTPQLGVVLCNPFGQEAIRSHRIFRVIAERLARNGVPALRFDYFGSGDSDGEDDEVSLARWSADVIAADAALRRLTGCSRTAWLGLRLGATVAALAASSARLPPDRLIAWDPVLNGAGYLDSLTAAHRTGLERAFPIAAPESSRPGGGLKEAMGFSVPARLAGELRALDSKPFERCRCRRIVWLLPSDRSAPPGVAAASRAERVGAVDWSTDEALNTALVPGDVVTAILGEVNQP